MPSQCLPCEVSGSATAQEAVDTRECLTATKGPDDRDSTVRPGLHALDRSYGQLFVNAFLPVGLNVSVRWSGGANGLRACPRTTGASHDGALSIAGVR